MPDIFQHIGKSLIYIGISFIVLGSIILLLRHTGLPFPGKLPGDIVLEKKNFTFYFPVATSIILSLILSLLFYFLGRK